MGDFARPLEKRFNYNNDSILFSGCVYLILIHFFSSASFLPSLMILLYEIVFDFELSSNLPIYLSFTMDWRSELKLVIYKTIFNVHFFHQNCDLTLLYRRNTKELLSPFNGRLPACKYNQSQWHGLSIKQSCSGGKDSYLLTRTLNICTHFVLFSLYL